MLSVLCMSVCVPEKATGPLYLWPRLCGQSDRPAELIMIQNTMVHGGGQSRTLLSTLPPPSSMQAVLQHMSGNIVTHANALDQSQESKEQAQKEQANLIQMSHGWLIICLTK